MKLGRRDWVLLEEGLGVLSEVDVEAVLPRLLLPCRKSAAPDAIPAMNFRRVSFMTRSIARRKD